MEEQTKAYYKYCVVPMCENNIKSAPDKIYFHMPKDAKIRKKWCKAMRRDKVSCLSSLYCCEDHFDIEQDTENYMKYKIMALELGQKMSLLLKKGVVPHIFRCQKKERLRPPPERKGALKRKRQSLIEEALAEPGPSTATTPNFSQANQDNITQDEHETTNKLNQIHMTHTFRSKPIKTEIKLGNQTTSPFRPYLQSVCRVCLAFDVKMYDMRDFELSEMFEKITGIEITGNNHSMTEHLCWECAARMKAAVSFRNKALLSDALLQGLVTAGKDIQKTDIISIKENYENIKSNLSIHEVFHVVHIEGNGEEEEQSSISENIDAEIVQSTLTEGLIELKVIKEENIETEIIQNTIPEDSIELEYTKKNIKKEHIESEMENDDESMVYIPIKTEDMEVYVKEEEEEYIFNDPLDKALSGDTTTCNSGELVT